jgi:hypothetical protein
VLRGWRYRRSKLGPEAAPAGHRPSVLGLAERPLREPADRVVGGEELEPEPAPAIAADPVGVLARRLAREAGDDRAALEIFEQALVGRDRVLWGGSKQPPPACRG